MAQCTAKSKRSGEQCRRDAMRGQEKCAMHGGKAKQNLAAAARRQAEAAATAEVARLGARRDIHPAEALLDLVHWTAGEVDYWRTRVQTIEDDDLVWGTTKVKDGGDDRGTTQEAKPHIAYVMLERASDRLATYAAAALKAGVEERRVRLAESQGALVGEVLRRILDRLALTEEQQQLVPVIVPEELRRLTSGGAA